jgi:hypothetical protein
MSDEVAGEAVDPDVVAAHTANARSRWMLARFAGAIASCYRTMDPVVAQVVAEPGVAPVVAADD